jgi:biopolymer transport protein ExbB/TolQ
VNELINSFVGGVINFTNDLLMPVMVLTFLGAVMLRFLIHLTVSRELWFAKAFQKRVYEYLLRKDKKKYSSFYVTTKHLLEKTYYELFIMRSVLKRRNPDIIMDKADRVFLVQSGCARLVKDTLKHVQFFRYDIHRPRTMDITAQIFEKNPQFNSVLGYLPIGTFNGVLNLLPGIFIVGGIFGTFLGIMKALPELGGMDLADIEKTKQVMDHFLVKMSYSMITSILGILLNVSMTFVNAFFNPNKLFVDIVERFDNALDTLWSSCSDNKLPSEIPDFDEHKDPIEALAEDAVNKEILKDKAFQAENEESEEKRIKAIIRSSVRHDNGGDEDKAA